MFDKDIWDTDVHIVRNNPLIFVPSHKLNFYNFHQVKRMIKGNPQHVVLDPLSNFKMDSAYFGRIQCLFC